MVYQWWCAGMVYQSRMFLRGPSLWKALLQNMKIVASSTPMDTCGICGIVKFKPGLDYRARWRTRSPQYCTCTRRFPLHVAVLECVFTPRTCTRVKWSVCISVVRTKTARSGASEWVMRTTILSKKGETGSLWLEFDDTPPEGYKLCFYRPRLSITPTKMMLYLKIGNDRQSLYMYLCMHTRMHAKHHTPLQLTWATLLYTTCIQQLCRHHEWGVCSREL